MATILTRNLKLRVDSNLTANSKYNLAKLDELGGIYQLDSTGQVLIRSATNISIEPEAVAVGGAGVGGIVSIGTSGHVLQSIHLYADEVTVPGALVVDALSIDGLGAGVLTSDVDGLVTPLASLPVTLGGTGAVTANAAINNLLPVQTGNSSKVLTTDGSNTSWQAVSANAAAMTEHDWTSGLTFSIPHGYSTQNYEVVVYDSLGEQVFTTVTIDSSNTVLLTSSEAPSGTWRVVLVGA